MWTTPSWSGVRAWSSIRATPSRPFGSGGKRGEDRRRRHGVRRARRGGVSGRNRQRCRLCGCGRRQDRESPPEPAPDPRARTRAARRAQSAGRPPGVHHRRRRCGRAFGRHLHRGRHATGRHMDRPKLVVTKSTVPVGTAERVRGEIAKHTSTAFHICANPEFLKEGAAVEDFMKPDRVIVGVDSAEAADVTSQLYAPFVRTGNPIIFMDLPSAEMTKYAANAMLATRISFMNQIALLCDAVGADVTL